MSAPPSKKPPRKRIDWEAVQLAYRLGVESLRAIAAEQGCAESAIRKKAKEQDWPRDLSAKVKARTEELVRKAEVRKEVRTETATERQQIEISAQVKTNIILSHRTDIPIARTLAMDMLSELALQTTGRELLEELGELMRNEDKSGQDRKNDLYNKVIALSGRSDTLKKLADSLKVLVGLEREAFGLNTEESDPRDALTQLLHGITSGNNSSFKPVQDDPEHE